ncbi:MAG TPA: hypothetical protein DEG17_15615 [Cyanobacteria bacterium UBA11149]|nr:hypothetical protein [Cyanobacteria bacterium UBA11367]HBE59165.1 hypothetical protein [Cyanobacteria bacterium UBA11366]HBK64986.1 hypothetical protein [Cyanobacteria bacterium UBA11166]HBR72729.1 hypothetical protein [Cyanobacteria bacterium UBA11159]HBS69206.1 hypothetical protein [Cyanobacteria bacterium UBA11153]HBW90259.1 hypothetical protein [Cyanobacteria bacterium UBA11149]HCA94091.1 hypothetical protein [Cyanobacteria bacterium UBA9226]
MVVGYLWLVIGYWFLVSSRSAKLYIANLGFLAQIFIVPVFNPEVGKRFMGTRQPAFELTQILE